MSSRYSSKARIFQGPVSDIKDKLRRLAIKVIKHFRDLQNGWQKSLVSITVEISSEGICLLYLRRLKEVFLGRNQAE